MLPWSSGHPQCLHRLVPSGSNTGKNHCSSRSLKLTIFASLLKSPGVHPPAEVTISGQREQQPLLGRPGTGVRTSTRPSSFYHQLENQLQVGDLLHHSLAGALEPGHARRREGLQWGFKFRFLQFELHVLHCIQFSSSCLFELLNLIIYQIDFYLLC